VLTGGGQGERERALAAAAQGVLRSQAPRA
jgi:hypothetical protein